MELFSDKIINFRCSKNIYKIIILTEMLTVSLLYWVSTSQAKATLIYSVWKLKDIYLCAKELYLTLICLNNSKKLVSVIFAETESKNSMYSLVNKIVNL